MRAIPPVDSRYEEVRRQLRERGYLQGRIERFLLADLLAAGSTLGRLVRASLKAALVGAPVLGTLLAGAAAVSNQPPLKPADLGLLWLYCALIAGVGLFLLDLSVASFMVLLARKRGARAHDALAAALVVAIPTLAYLIVLWWRRHQGVSLVLDVLFFVLALGGTLLVAWLGGLVSLAGIIGRTGQIPDRRRYAMRVLVVAVVPLMLGLLLLQGRMSAADGPVQPPTFTVPENAGGLLLVGVDGLDGELLQAFVTRGGMQSLVATMARGAVFPMRRDVGAEQAEVWTTLLTGTPVALHGVKSAGASHLPGLSTPLSARARPLALEAALGLLLPARTVPSSAASRKMRTLWEIVGLRRRAVAVGWWASWPATSDSMERGGAYVVTDRVLPKLLAGTAGDRDTWPPSLYERLRGEFDGDRRLLREQFEAAFTRGPSEELQRWLWESFLIDGYASLVAERLLTDRQAHAAFVYFPGLDILRHRLTQRVGAGGASELLEAPAALSEYAAALEGLLARLMELRAGWHVLLVADPGRGMEAEDEGFVFVLGPRAQQGCVGPMLVPIDLPAIALDLLGFPRSRELPGRMPSSCFERGSAEPGGIASYGPPPAGEGSPFSDYDAEMVRRLKSLGYLN